MLILFIYGVILIYLLSYISLDFFSAFVFKIFISSNSVLISTAGGVAKPFCPYKCMSEKYRMPNCYTPLEELIYTFGGPWPFAILLSFIIVIFAILLSTIRIKLVGSGYAYRAVDSSEHHNRHHFPLLLSLAEVTFINLSTTHLYCLEFEI